MPLIVVHGLTVKELEQSYTDPIEKAIIAAVIGIRELQLTKKDVSFSFIHDPTIASGNTTVMIIVELLFERPKRTLEVRQRLAEAIAEAFKGISGNQNRLIEVAVKRFNPKKDGFCRIFP